jgi:hypothetical protein
LTDPRRVPAASAAVAALLTVLALGIAARGLVRHNNWYLASDQFAFLTFAADLRSGTVFHDDEVLEQIAPQRSRVKRYDALSQTYFWRDGSLHSRYPPGFPALLAAAGALGGEVGEHALNPLLYLALLIMVAVLTWALVAPQDAVLALGAGAAAAWLVLVVDTGVHLWGITVVRDLPAHLLAFAAILAAAKARPLLAGLSLGAACLIRVDAILYAAALGTVQSTRRACLRETLVGTAGFAVGVAPLLLYNLVAEGSLLSFTEGGELREIWSRGATDEWQGVALAQTFAAPSGGAFRLSHLASSLPANAAYLGRAFGWLLPFAATGIHWALRDRRIMAAALLPYPLLALLFYSFWVHPDFRYLTGATLCLVPFVALGAARSCHIVATGGRLPRVLAVAAGILVLAAPRLAAGEAKPGSAAVALYAGVAVLALLPRRRGLRRFAPLGAAVALAVVTTARAWASEGPVRFFQRAEVEAARAAIRSSIPPGSLLMVAPGLGRPVENLRVYAGLEAFYVGEMALLDRPESAAAIVFAGTGRRVFYLLGAGDRSTAARLSPLGRLRPVGERRGRDLLEWFVDPRRATQGAVLYELDVDATTREQLRRYLRLDELPGVIDRRGRSAS